MDAQIKRLFKTLPKQRRARSTWLGIALFTFCGAAWLSTFALVVGAPIWLSAPASFAHGITIAMLFIVGHDAGHGSLVPSLQLNRVIGTIAFLPSLHPFSGWKRSHNVLHHGWTNLKGEDPGYPPFSWEEFRSLSPARRLMERFYRSWGGLGFFYFAEIYWKGILFPTRNHPLPRQKEFLFDRLFVAAFLVVEIGGVFCISLAADRAFPILFAMYAVLCPYCVFLWLMAYVTYQHHTNAEIPWFDRKAEWSFFQNQVEGTTHVAFPRIFDVFFLHILDHSAHHVDPLIPLYNLDKSQLALETAYPDSIKIIGWSPSVFLRTLRCCKLYDYREHCWLDFNGWPTTRRLVSRFETSPSATITPMESVLPPQGASRT